MKRKSGSSPFPALGLLAAAACMEHQSLLRLSRCHLAWSLAPSELTLPKSRLVLSPGPRDTWWPRAWARGSTEARHSDAAVVVAAGTRAKKAGPPPPISKRGMERCSRRSWAQAPPLTPVPWIWTAFPGSRSWPAERRTGSPAKGTGGSTAVPCPTLTSDAVSGRLGRCQCSLSCRILGNIAQKRGRRLARHRELCSKVWR